jgi:hypothetical protein
MQFQSTLHLLCGGGAGKIAPFAGQNSIITRSVINRARTGES